MKHSEFLCTNCAFGQLAANVRVRLFFEVTCLCCIFELTSAIFIWRALRHFATDMANVVEEMVGTREAEAAEVATESGGAVVTESGGAVATESGGAVATESGRAATTGDATAGDDTAATCGVMYAAEGPYTIDVRHVEAMVGSTREAADGDRVRRGSGDRVRRDGDSR